MGSRGHGFRKYSWPMIAAWALVYALGLTLWLVGAAPWYFQACIQAYFVFFGVVDLFYAFNSSHSFFQEKKPRAAVLNEVLLALMFFSLAAYFPALFPTSIKTSLRIFIFFNLWDSLSVHLACWGVYLYFAKRNNQKKHREMAYDEWILVHHAILAGRSDYRADIKRKLMHFAISAGIVLIYVISLFLRAQLARWEISFALFVRYWWFAIAIHLLWVMNISDLLRLWQFRRLGRFATRWFESSISPKEHYTFTSASIMIITWVPFLLAPGPIFMVVGFVSSISDALASIVGKRYGKKKVIGNKTVAGFIAGAGATYLICLILFSIFSPMFSVLHIQILSILAAGGFFLVDFSNSPISDNFLNSMVVGFSLWLAIFFIFP